jgi:hypothetical protein
MTHHTTTTTHTTTRRRGLFGRRQPVVHQKRHATFGDKISGALKKLKGTIMGRPGVKVSFQIPIRKPVSTKTACVYKPVTDIGYPIGCRYPPHAWHRWARLAPPGSEKVLLNHSPAYNREGSDCTILPRGVVKLDDTPRYGLRRRIATSP